MDYTYLLCKFFDISISNEIFKLIFLLLIKVFVHRRYEVTKYWENLYNEKVRNLLFLIEQHSQEELGGGGTFWCVGEIKNTYRILIQNLSERKGRRMNRYEDNIKVECGEIEFEDVKIYLFPIYSTLIIY
jgi:hypothetical protein